ncbi:L-2-hydroxyglutarate oxidase [Desulfovibrio inopinatus]|uniref:L-2-hydroxyglutarate oxidase n=1 Tax=Desulfovibrio inopinatus TaxID=102109 RepID=UPI0004166EA4|nr:L-2-hydroxyglutarate oxidase [Desulfovibrio inopinatus]
MEHAEILISGAGIVGLSIARELLRRGYENIVLLEKETDVGKHASGRNSGVLHAGIYYAPGSTKAQTCLRGNRMMREYCREKGLPLEQSGKVIVASSHDEHERLLALYDRARTIGAAVSLIDTKELAEIEPAAATVEKAIHSPETAVINPKRIVQHLVKDITADGRARILFETAFVRPIRPGLALTTSGPLRYRRFINASGAYSDVVAQAFGLGHAYQLVPFKGLYRQLVPERRGMIRGSIYPVPDIRNPFLGVHFTKSVAGEVHIGPTAIPALGRENYSLFGGLDAEAFRFAWRDVVLFTRNAKFRTIALTEPRKYMFSQFFKDASKLVKHLNPTDIAPSSKVGIRPQLVNVQTNELVMDFLVEEHDGDIHILNAISPAFTSSFAFAETIADLFDSQETKTPDHNDPA